MGRKRKNVRAPAEEEDNGFAQWGGYMNAKKSKLNEQFQSDSTKYITKITDIFKDVAIFINGFTSPSAEELKIIMAQHGGVYHTYQMKSTTHIIASNLPNVKIKQLGSLPIVKPEWITDSLASNKLLDYKKYILYTNESVTQPKLNFQLLGNHNNSIKEQTQNNTNSECKKPTKTASDPHFLEEFYNNSRLHLISTLGAEFKQLVNKLREDSNGRFPGRENLMKNNEHLSNERQLSSEKTIMHIDMDCFFVSVGLRNRPDLKNKPVAVTHARNGRTSNGRQDRSIEIDLYKKRLPDGAVDRLEYIDSHSSMSEIASCSYEARKLGIKNGMFLGAAVKLCPDLKTIPYDFQAYKEVSTILYNTLASYTLDIEAVSCDEMYVDVTDVLSSTNLSINDWATHIRSEIMGKTGCPCSTGFGGNRLQARLATKSAKPAGQFYLSPDNVEDYMQNICLSDLPGVGFATLSKLNKLGLYTCGDAQGVSLKVLQTELGNKNGETLYDQVRGIDKVPLSYTHERKSVSAEVNYGIRFKSLEETRNFLNSLSQEVFRRLKEINMRAKCLTLKLMVRSPDAPKETAKFLGHGVCDTINKSTTGSVILNDPQTIFKEVLSLYGKIKVDFADLRGVGLQLTKLEKNAVSNQLLDNFLKSAPAKTVAIEPTKLGKPVITKKEVKPTKLSPITMLLNKNNKPTEVNSLPVDCGFDVNVFNELPKSIQKEILKDLNIKQPLLKNSQPTSTIINNNKIPSNSTIHNGSKNKKVSPFDGMSLEEFKTAVKHWLAAEAEPSPFDVNLVKVYLQQLALTRKIENLKIILSFLYRNITPLNCSWHSAYYRILNKAQEKMIIMYGAVLKADNKFPCNKCNNYKSVQTLRT